MKKIPSDYRITTHGIDHNQYFQGHGVSFSKFTDCATGIGDSEIEAFNDALESLAQNDWDVSIIEAKAKEDIEAMENIADIQENRIHEMLHDGCDNEDECDHENNLYFYVSVDVIEAKDDSDLT